MDTYEGRKPLIYHGSLDNLDDLDGDVKKAVAALRPHKKQFDSIVVTGMSGVVVGAPVALALRKQLCIVRKPKDDCHHSRRVINGVNLGTRALFFDDFVCTGDTKHRITEAVTKDGLTKVCGEYLYRDDELTIDGARVFGE